MSRTGTEKPGVSKKNGRKATAAPPVEASDSPTTATVFETLVERSNDGIIIIRDGMLQFVNGKMTGMTGYSREEVLGKPFLDFVTPEFKSLVGDRYRRRTKAGEAVPERYEAEMLHKNGTKIPIEINSSLIEHAGKPAVMAIVRDISKRKQMEERLRRNEAFLENIIEQTPSALYISDAKGTALKMNRALGDLLNIREAEIVGKYNVLNDTQVREQGLLPLVESVFKEGKTVRFTIDYHTGKEKQVRLKQQTDKVLEIVLSAVKDSEGRVIYAICQEKDVTEQKRIEKELAESEIKYRSIVENSHDAILLTTPDGGIVAANTAACRMFARTEEEICRLGRSGVMDATDPRLEAALDQRRRTGEFKGEITFLRADGTKFPGEMTSRVFLDADGNTRTSMIIRDMTERRQAEDRLKWSEERYRDLFDNTSDLIQSVAPDGHILYANKAWRQTFGYSEMELAKLTIMDIIHPDCLDKCMAVFHRVISGEDVRDVEAVFSTKQGERVYVEGSAHCRSIEGRPVSTQGIFHNVTGRKKAEEALRASQQNFRNSLDGSPLGVRIADAHGETLYANQALLDIYGYASIEELKATPATERYLPESQAEFRERRRRRKNAEPVPADYEIGVRRKDGQIRYLHVFRKDILWDGRPQFEVIYEDITERKQATAELEMERKRLESVTSNVGVGLALISRDYHTVWANDVIRSLFGETTGEICYSTYNKQPSICPWCGVKRVFENKEERVETEAHGYDVNGEEVWSQLIATPVRNETGEITGALEVVIPITERMKAAKALRESEANFRNLVDYSPLGIRIGDEEDRTIYMNRALLDILGYAGVEEVKSRSYQELYTADSYADHEERVRKRKRGETVPLRYEVAVVRSDGEVRHLLASRGEVFWNGKKQVQVLYQDITERKATEAQMAHLASFPELNPNPVIEIDESGNITYLNPAAITLFPDLKAAGGKNSFLAGWESLHEKTAGTGTFSSTRDVRVGESWFQQSLFAVPQSRNYRIYSADISERKRAEQALADEANHRRILMEQSRDGIAVFDQEGLVVESNQRLADMLGYTIEEMLHIHIWDFDSAVPREQIMDMLRNIDEKGLHFETRHIRKDGSEYDAEVSSNGAVFAGRKLVFSVTRDITERKQAEKALRASEERWQFALEGAGDGVWDWNYQTNTVFFSRRWKAMLGYAEDGIGDTLDEWDERVHPDDRERVNVELQQYLDGITPTYSSEHRMLCKDGSYKWILDRGKIVSFTDDGQPLRIIGTHTDITRIKQIQENLTRSNRALRLISAGNEALVRASEETSLLNIICRLIVTIGDYQMAWVGFAQDDAEKTVLPVANAGLEEGYLQAGKITWGDDESGRGTTGTAIRTGQPDVIRDISNDPRSAPWKEAALERGYASSLALPLSGGSGVFGALSLFSTEPDAFYPEEIELLTELANDLAFGIAALRLQAERKVMMGNLASSEQKYRTLFETAVEGIVIGDPVSRKFHYTNPAFCRLAGYTNEELGRMGIDDLHAKESLEMAIAEFDALWQGRKKIATNIPFLRKDGTIIYADITLTRVFIDGTERFAGFLSDATQRRLVAQERRQTEKKLLGAMIKTIELMSRTMELKDPYTAGHQERVTVIASAIAKEMGLDETEVEGIRLAAIVHDLGKIYVPSEILSKPGRLSDLEFSLIKLHPQAGYDLLKDVAFPWPIASMILQHHERMNGSGYPQGLKGKDILPGARILAVADVVEAMGSHRPYRPSLGIEKALAEITANQDILYDAGVVDACMRLFKKGFEFEKKPSA
jgi:PAS domain S-box-containing protein